MGVDLNASMAKHDFSDQTDVSGQITDKVEFKIKMLRLCFWVIKEALKIYLFFR